MTKVKICGIQDLETAKIACNNGADFLGFVFAESKRQITPLKAKKIISELPSNILTVGVFVNLPFDETILIAEFCNLDIIQLHGQETPESYKDSDFPIIKSVSVKPSGLNEAVNIPESDYLLFDTWHESMAGGSGKTFNWNFLDNYNSKKPFFLAGGLNAENVREAIKHLTPFAVDVSSGVESNGIKDHKKIIEFLKIVKEAQ